jgi:hypothetical protein
MVKLKRDIATWTRWLHIYLSMFSFAALLFFAVTGITLNHTSWIEGKQKVEQVQGNLNTTWVSKDSSRVNELLVVEHFRNNHQVKAALSDFSTNETECTISFKGPGYNADAFIDRANGKYELTITKSGWIAVMNDLHKGRDTGNHWSWLIDVSAVLMILVSLTGFLMIFFLKKKRFSGLVITFIGAILLILIYYLFV